MRICLMGVVLHTSIGVGLAAVPGGGSTDPDRLKAPQDAAQPSEPATLRFLNRDIVTLRVQVAGAAPQQRVDLARKQLNEYAESGMAAPLGALPFLFQNAAGIQFMVGSTNLFAIVEGNVDRSRGQTLTDLSRQTTLQLEQALKAWHDANDRRILLLSLLKAVLATAGWVVLVLLFVRIHRFSLVWLDGVRDRIAARQLAVDRRELFARLAIGAMKLALSLVLLMLTYVWLRLILVSFVATQPLAHELDGWLFEKLGWVAGGALNAAPGLATVLIVLLLTRAVADVMGYLFEAVQQRRLQLPFLHQETTTATRRIVTAIVWVLGIAIAYPYLPGSSSEAFKGLSVLFGVMLTLNRPGF